MQIKEAICQYISFYGLDFSVSIGLLLFTQIQKREIFPLSVFLRLNFKNYKWL